MKKISVILVFIFANISGFCQEYTEADFLSDLEYFKITLPQKHTNLFNKISKIDFDKKVDEIKLKTEKLNYETFTAELFRLIVSIGDEHTRIEPIYTKTLPIKFEIYKEGIFAIGIDSSNLKALPAKLVAINNYPIRDVISRFKEVIQSKNNSYFEVGLLQFLNNPSFLKGLNIIDNNDSATFTLITKSGNELKINLKSIETLNNLNVALVSPFKNLLLNKHDDFYWYEYNAENKTIYFNYKKCNEQENISFDKFNDKLFTEIEKYKPEKIILDLRENSGGNSGVLRPFITQIKESYLNKKGRFFVLIGKKTFSSALMNAIELKRNFKAILIGEPTSGNINHYGEVRGFRLPKTKIMVGYSTKYWENWKGKKGPLIPDTKIIYSIQDLNNNIDAAISFANNY